MVFSLMQTRVGCVGMYIWENSGGPDCLSLLLFLFCVVKIKDSAKIDRKRVFERASR
jgi:hypothetical protein